MTSESGVLMESDLDEGMSGWVAEVIPDSEGMDPD